MKSNIIYNEDCLKTMERMADNSVPVVLTDIPYGEVSANGTERAKYSGQIRKMDKSDADTLTFDLSEFVAECSRVAEHSIYIFCAKGQFSTIFTELKDLGWSVRAGVWEKNNPSPMNGQHLWLSSVEMCVFARKKGATFNEHCKGTVWRYPNGSSKIHPTQKPIDLFKYLVNVSTNEGDVVYDPCIGSGTTAVACKELGRKYIGSELSKAYCDIAKQRLSQGLLFGGVKETKVNKGE